MKSTTREKTTEKIQKLRQLLHQFPELSGNEKGTRKRLTDFFRELNTDAFYDDIGGKSMAWEFSGESPETTVIFRADMDALPIEDEIDEPYRSENESVGHKCGHDGHMAVLAGLASRLSENPPSKTRIICLFQAEEETGQGAEKIVNHQWFRKLNPDYVFGLHNLPGFEQGTIIARQGIFASASVGMIIKLKGKSSHAGHPEEGISPAGAIANLTDFIIHEIDFSSFHDFSLATIIHFSLGEVAFGTSPGFGRFMLTLRAAREDDLEKLIAIIEDKCREVSHKEGLGYEISFTERFPSTENHEEGYGLVLQAAKDCSYRVETPGSPFSWSEDFGHYLKNCKGAFFGLGAGKKTPGLHHPDYDFPDEILENGIDMFYKICRILENEKRI